MKGLLFNGSRLKHQRMLSCASSAIPLDHEVTRCLCCVKRASEASPLAACGTGTPTCIRIRLDAKIIDV